MPDGIIKRLKKVFGEIDMVFIRLPDELFLIMRCFGNFDEGLSYLHIMYVSVREFSCNLLHKKYLLQLS